MWKTIEQLKMNEHFYSFKRIRDYLWIIFIISKKFRKKYSKFFEILKNKIGMKLVNFLKIEKK